jgi:hypothetical protein
VVIAPDVTLITFLGGRHDADVHYHIIATVTAGPARPGMTSVTRRS